MNISTALQVKDLVVRYGKTEILKSISFDVATGSVFGIVGESGCGKSTLAKTLTGLLPISSGSIDFSNIEKSAIQMIFQDASGSLNPRKTIYGTLSELLKVHRLVKPNGLKSRISELLGYVGLPFEIVSAYPQELSGGQCQRISIARALAMNPKILIADEPVSALDVSVQARVLNVLSDLRKRFGLTILLISHDLAVVRTICESVIIMKAGEIVERGSAANCFTNPQHQYTKQLIDAIPDVRRSLKQRIYSPPR